MNGDYIKLSRSILEWEWYKNINTKVLFLHMILKANWKDGKFEGKIIPKGSFVSSIKILSDETGLTEREVRTGISHLKMTGEVTSKSYSKYTVFSIKNYDTYQSVDKQNDKQVTSERHSNDILTPTIEEGKKGKNICMCVRAREKYHDRFNEFWKSYPKKVNMLNAQSEYTYVLETTAEISEDDLITAAANYAEYCTIRCTKEQYIKNPENWLKESAWIDYLPENYKKPDSRKKDRKPNAKKNAFNNFHQRSYDFDEFEKLMLNTNPNS